MTVSKGKKMNKKLITLSFAFAAGLVASSALAMDYTWDATVTSGNWADPACWIPAGGDKGPDSYPKTADDKATFPASAAVTVNGEGGSFDVEALVAETGAEVKLSDITVRINSAKFDPTGATWIFDKAQIDVVASHYRLQPTKGTTVGYHVVLEHGANLGMNLYNTSNPSARNGKMTVRDGKSAMNAWEMNIIAGEGTDEFLYITNATFTVGSVAQFKDNCPFLLKIRDGQFATGSAFPVGKTVVIDLELPPEGLTDATAPIVVGGGDFTMVEDAGTIKVDVSRFNCVSGMDVTFPLVRAAGAVIVPDSVAFELVGAPNGVTGSLVAEGKRLLLHLTSEGPQTKYSAQFVDWDETPLADEQFVAYCDMAVPPANPVRDGFVFTGWEPSNFKVVSNTVFTATYVQADTPVYGDEDLVPVTYTWNPQYPNGRWDMPMFWQSDVEPCYGIPHSKTNATVKFVSDAEIDLAGGSFNTDLLTSDPFVTVKICNGKLYEQELTMRMEYATLILKDVEFTNKTWPDNQSYHTIILEGNSSMNCYRPWSAKYATMIVRDGESEIKGFNGSCKGSTGDGSEHNLFMVTNAVLNLSGWTGQGTCASGRPLVVRDGAERQGRVLFTNKGDTDVNFYRYDLQIPKEGLPQPPIEIKNMHTFCSLIWLTAIKSTNANPRVTVDVTNYMRSKPVPLVRYESTSYEQLPGIDLTTIPADAKTKYKAQVYWEDNTLWYKQNGRMGMTLIVR